MITAAEALDMILGAAKVLPAECIPVARAAERILASDLTATCNNPPFDNSAMDGFAVHAADLAAASRQNPVELPTRETIAAGSSSARQVSTGEAVRIMTGAAMPDGADAVVMQEFTEPGSKGCIRFLHAPKLGDHIRKAGEDVKTGSPLMAAGIRIRPLEVALMASQGLREVAVIRRPRVGILATGDELVEPGTPLAPGQIWDSNGPALAAALSRWGIDAVVAERVPDNAAAIEGRMRSLLDASDVVLVSGGVSVGEFDHCKAVFEKIGIRQIFWGVAVKPGKPLYFGVLDGNAGRKLVFGLPGNPVSVLVSLDEFVRVALEKLQGYTLTYPSFHLTGMAANAYSKPASRQTYLFCQVAKNDDGYAITIVRPQGSGMIGMASRANALAIHAMGNPPIKKGDKLSFRWLK